MVASAGGRLPVNSNNVGAFDFRSWIEKARRIGQLREVENADLTWSWARLRS